MTDNHFISVSRKGVLMARRNGGPPVEVARAEDGLEITVDRDPPIQARVDFAPGGSHRQVQVVGIRIGAEALTVDEFFARFGANESDLGRWMRNAVEEALSEADTRLHGDRRTTKNS